MSSRGGDFCLKHEKFRRWKAWRAMSKTSDSKIIPIWAKRRVHEGGKRAETLLSKLKMVKNVIYGGKMAPKAR